jgi:signal transduction histidine kinase
MGRPRPAFAGPLETMPSDPDDPSVSRVSDDALLLLNRATLVTHAVRTAVHELNNVLQMISGSAELLADNPGLPSNANPRVDAILRQAARGHAILESVTALARHQSPGVQTTDLHGAAERALASRRYEHTRAGITASLERLGEGDVRVRIDPVHLQQILLNLLVNAEQALSGVAGPSIRTTIGRTGDAVTLEIADNGPGVGERLALFTPFVTSRAPGSAGLGLAAARTLAVRYEGSLEQAPSERGSRWILRLPGVTL